MKQLIIDKIDRLIDKGYEIESEYEYIRIGDIEVRYYKEMTSEYCAVRWINLNFEDSLYIYEYLRENKQQQFIEYLKGD